MASDVEMMFLTHVEEYVTVEDGSRDIKIMFALVKEGGIHHLSVIITESSSGGDEKIIEEKFDNAKSCAKFMQLAISKFKEFTPKILYFDDLYDDEFISQKMEAW